MKENGGCVHRVCGIPGDIFYAVSISSNGNVAVGGADRTVTIYDPRRLAAVFGFRKNHIKNWLVILVCECQYHLTHVNIV